MTDKMSKERLASLLEDVRDANIDTIVDYLADNGVVVPVRCMDCIHAKPVTHKGEVIDWSYRCTYLKPNTNMFDIDYCRYGKLKEEAERKER